MRRSFALKIGLTLGSHTYREGERGRCEILIIDLKIWLMWMGVGVDVCAHDDHTTQPPHATQATPARARCVADPGSELGSFRR